MTCNHEERLHKYLTTMRDLHETSISDLQSAMQSGELSVLQLVRYFLQRIESLARLNAVIETNPDAEAIAAALDTERAAGHVRGPLHGIPILLKDNIGTADRMMTTAGSLALIGRPPERDATVAMRLRAAGVVLLGKTNMSEWANFRSTHSASGWCARNGQSHNPYILDRSPCGSSSGSGIAAAAGLAVAAIGTETDGSIVCPASANGVVGIKPTVGLTSRAGVVPISHTQDSIGPHARTVADAAAVLAALAAEDERDPATAAARDHFPADYTRCLDPGGLKGARIGIVRNQGFGASPKTDAIMADALHVLRNAGAILIDPADIPADEKIASDAEMLVMLHEFKADLNTYLATRAGVAVEREGFGLSLAGVIAFNEAHHDLEMPYFDQELFVMAQEKGPLTDRAYLEALSTSRRLSGPEGIDKIMDQHQLDALVAPSGGPACPIDLVNGESGGFGSAGPAARAGYPVVSVPAGYVFNLPVNISFMGRAFSEPTLIRLAYAFEQATLVRRPPRYQLTLQGQ